ncbi:MAG: tRNA modification GTPase [Acidobacteriota bacterium]
MSAAPPLPPVSDGDTIVAEATPPGQGGLSLVRLSGPQAWNIAGQLFAPRGRAGLSVRRCTIGDLQLEGGRDRATATAFRAPSSPTGEDVVELAVHGSPWLVQAVVEAAVEAGARCARPGEFTHRAWRSGKLTLTEAEALDSLIRADSPAAVREAMRQHGGSIDEAAARLESELVEALAELEAAVDFHDDSQGQRRIDESLGRVRKSSAAWLSAGRNRALSTGLRVVLSGPPNAGKSRLFNALLADERAIVTAEAGTTRDVLEGRLVLSDLVVTLVDTAGQREATSEAEAEGVRRSQRERERADLVLEVREVEDQAPGWPEGGEHWRVLNKVDLLTGASSTADESGPRRVSAATGEGVDALREALASRAREGVSGEAPVLLVARQREVAGRLQEHLDRAVEDRRVGQPEELVAESVRRALDELAELRGRVDDEDVYGRIFSRFCVGK